MKLLDYLQLISRLESNFYLLLSISFWLELICRFRRSRLQIFFKIGAFKNFTNFTGKHLCWSFFLKKLQTFNPVQDGPFGGCSRRGGSKRFPLAKISYTLLEQDPKNIWITWHTTWVVLTSAFFIGYQQISLYQEIQI